MGFIADLRLQSAKRQLQSQLKECVELAEGHKSVDLPPGNRIYKLLEQRAQKAIVDFQAKQTNLGIAATDYEEIAAGVPQLRQLEALAEGKQEPSTVAKIVPLTFVSGIVITAMLAIYHNLYLWITHFANTKWGH